jgi:hypothetical protein
MNVTHYEYFVDVSAEEAASVVRELFGYEIGLAVPELRSCADDEVRLLRPLSEDEYDELIELLLVEEVDVETYISIDGTVIRPTLSDPEPSPRSFIPEPPPAIVLNYREKMPTQFRLDWITTATSTYYYDAC